MRKLLILTAAAALFAACTTSFTRNATDKADSYAKAIDVVRKNVDGERFKIYSLDITEEDELSDNIHYIVVKMVNRDDQAFSQTFFVNGMQPSALSEVQRTFQAPTYAATRGIDLGALDPQQIETQIAQAKTMLPEGYTFKSIGNYLIEESVPSGNELFNRGKTFGEQTTRFTVRFTEDGKETESSAGQTSYIYYEAKATVNPDGSLILEEN